MLLILLALAVSVPGPPVLASTSLVMPKAGDAVVSVTVNDSQFPAATALDILVDGDVRTTVLLFGKVGHGPYSALLHALPAGRHDVAAQPSPYWTWPASAGAPVLTAFPAPDSIVIAHAPAL